MRRVTAPAADVLKLQRPLPDDALLMLARGSKRDGQSPAGTQGRSSNELQWPLMAMFAHLVNS